MDTLVIDVDSHFQEPPEWLATVDKELAEQISPQWYFQTTMKDRLSFFADDCPPDRLAEAADELPWTIRKAQDYASHFPSLDEAARALAESHFRGQVYPWAGYRPEERIAHLDSNNVRAQVLNPASALITLDRVADHLGPDAMPRVIRAYNTWALTTVDGHTDRLMPTVLLWWENPAWCVRELQRTRALGSRTFLLPGRPVAGKSIVHGDFDQVWAAASDLGMTGILHLGFLGAPALADGWYRTGRPELSDVGYVLGSIAPMVPQVVTSSLIASGVFERYPDLHLILEEYNASEWAPAWIRSLDSLLDLHVLRTVTGKWALPLKPSEYFRRQVLLSAQPGDKIDDAMQELGEDSVVFSSDFPHPEGSETATAAFVGEINEDATTARKMSSFLGGRMQQILAQGA